MDQVVELAAAERTPDLESMMDRAEVELSQDEQRSAVDRAHVLGAAAGSRALRRWLVGLALASIVVAALLADAWFLLACAVLGMLYGLPVYLAASSTARRDEETRVITRRLGRHARGEPMESADELAIVWPTALAPEVAVARWETEGGAPRRRRVSSASG